MGLIEHSKGYKWAGKPKREERNDTLVYLHDQLGYQLLKSKVEREPDSIVSSMDYS